MAASNKNELSLENLGKEVGASVTESAAPLEAADEPQSENAAPVEPVADDAIAADEDADTSDDDADTDDS